MRRPSLRSDRAFFYCLQYHCLSFILITSLQTYCRTAEGVHLSLRFTFFVTLSVPRSCRHTTHSKNDLAPRVRWSNLFSNFNCIFVLKTDGNFSSSGRLLFFRFCVCKGNYSLHCECKDRHVVFFEKSPHLRVVFIRKILAFIP